MTLIERNYYLIQQITEEEASCQARLISFGVQNYFRFLLPLPLIWFNWETDEIRCFVSTQSFTTVHSSNKDWMILLLKPNLPCALTSPVGEQNSWRHHILLELINLYDLWSPHWHKFTNDFVRSLLPTDLLHFLFQSSQSRHWKWAFGSIWRGQL